MKAILLEAVVVALSGAVIAFAANAISPRGLKISRNYFPISLPHDVASTNQLKQVARGTNTPSPAELLARRVKELGFQLVDTPRMIELFKDPTYELGQIAFIDAREEGRYAEGHIPGAYEFNYYRPEPHLPTILPICQVAQRIVVYCNGGDCDDSILTATFLRDSAQVPAEKIWIYGGGFTVWSTNGVPVELGSRRSGTMRNP